MEPIKTASTLERIVRNGIVTAMVLGFGLLSIRDGYIKYPAHNLEKLKAELPAEAQDDARINPKVWSENIAFVEKGINLEEVEAELGAPSYKGPIKTNVFKAVWFGPGGSLLVRYDKNGTVLAGPKWTKGQKRETDLFLQKVMGAVLTPLGLILAIRLLLMATRGARFSDAGLQPSGKPLIPFEAMTGWDTADYARKGRIRLTYALDGQEGEYILDDYKLRAFRKIVAEICARKDFENPIRKKEQAQGSTDAPSD